MLIGTGLFCLVSVAAAGVAYAQDGASSDSVAIRIGAGAAHSFHGDLNFHAPAVEGEVGFRLSPRVGLDLGFGQWRRNQTEVDLDIPIPGPSGPIGSAARIERQTRQVFSSLEANVVATGRAGPLRISAGGGAGFLTYARTFTQTIDGCSGAVMCGATETHFSSVSPTVQAIGRFEVPAGRRVSAYVSTRLWINRRDVGGSGIRTMAGIRIGLN